MENKSKEFFMNLNMIRLFQDYQSFYIEIDGYPVEVDGKIDKLKFIVKIPIYRKLNSRVYTVDYQCPIDLFRLTLIELIPIQTYEQDLLDILKNNFYNIVQNHLYENGHIVDEIFEVYVGIFTMTIKACSEYLNNIDLSIEELEEQYSHYYSLYRNAIPNEVFMRYKR